MRTMVIGGGLSGLALANALEAAGRDYLLLEARNRFGGRIMTEHHEAGHFDMGPTWFWPGQPRIAALIDQLGLGKFDQYADGDLLFEDDRGHVQRGRGFASMEGSWRLNDGLAAITDSLASKLPGARTRLNAHVKTLIKTSAGITATLSDGGDLTADQVALALPPRIAAEIAFSPPLPDTAVHAMRNVPTWMAGQAKAVAVYDTAFWREADLSGDASSRFGPMVEIHDASPAEGGPYALFGFISVPPEGQSDEQLLRQHLLRQLIHLFGPDAAEPAQLYIKDWAFDPHTSTEADKAPLYAHPSYGLPNAMTGLWDNTLHFSGTEVAPLFGGYIEGALEAAEIVFDALENQPDGQS